MRNTGYTLNSFLGRTSLKNRNSNTEIQNAVRNCSNGFVLSSIYKIREDKGFGDWRIVNSESVCKKWQKTKIEPIWKG